MSNFIQKPWGSEFIGQRVGKCSFKVLTVLRGHRLSRQKHKKKKEVWLVVHGTPWVECGVFNGKMKPGEFLTIRPGAVHRLSAVDGDVTVWEMQHGDDADIERIEDDYGRKEKT